VAGRQILVLQFPLIKSFVQFTERLTMSSVVINNKYLRLHSWPVSIISLHVYETKCTLLQVTILSLRFNIANGFLKYAFCMFYKQIYIVFCGNHCWECLLCYL